MARGRSPFSCHLVWIRHVEPYGDGQVRRARTYRTLLSHIAIGTELPGAAVTA
jgi:hypothetical protein